MERLNKNIQQFEKQTQGPSIVQKRFSSPQISTEMTSYELSTKMDNDHSPCKSLTFSYNDTKTGVRVYSRECAADNDQLNKFTIFHCVTIKQTRIARFVNQNNRVRIIKTVSGIGCELRFKPIKNYLNKL